MNDLERELEFELRRVLDPISRLPIPPRHKPLGASYLKGLFGGAGAALAIKVLTGVAVAAAAATVAGAATTGTLNPTTWGEQVTDRVNSCKADLTHGQQGIGNCVSDLTSHHAAGVSNATRQHGNGQGQKDSTGSGTGNTAGGPGQGEQNGKDTGHGQKPKPKGQNLPNPSGP